MLNIKWDNIDTVLLDLDGTLIDLRFDYEFWTQIVPQAYAEKNHIHFTQAQAKVKARCDAIAHDINWYRIDFWANEFNLPLEILLLKHGKTVAVRSGVYPFLDYLKQEKKQLILLTDSSQISLDIKMENSQLAPYFQTCLSSQRFHATKRQMALWQRLHHHIGFDPKKTLLIDDTEAVLDRAKLFGIAYTLGVENPNSLLMHQTFVQHHSCHDFRHLF